MRTAESWDLALEAISTVPFTFGFLPAESVVVLSLDAEEKSFTIGATGRVDLDALFAARDAGQFGAMVEITGPIARAGRSGGLVAVWSDVEGHEEASELLEFVAGMMAAEWPFEYHWGTFLVSPQGVLGMNADGEHMGWKDSLELTTTRFAMGKEACSIPVGSASLRVPRLEDPEAAAPAATAWEDVMNSRWTGALTRALTREVQEAVEAGALADPEAQGRIGAALANRHFRDGLMVWALVGAPPTKSFPAVPVEEWLELADQAPPPDEVDTVIRLLLDVASNLPEGEAAPALGTAAFLSWFAGQGARPRELMEQALEEDPDYTLALIVRDCLAATLPPPWVRRRTAVA